jgi:hypothetical protein
MYFVSGEPCAITDHDVLGLLVNSPAVDQQRRVLMEMYQKAERAAQEAVLRAAQQCASIGIPYTPPPNVNVNLQDIKMVSGWEQSEAEDCEMRSSRYIGRT